MKGTNIELLKYICNLTSSPVIVLGGIGNFVDIEKIFKNLVVMPLHVLVFFILQIIIQ